MTSSPIEARVPFPTFFDAEDAPTDTYYAQVLANNALHQADQYAQVRVNWKTPSSANGTTRMQYLEPETPLAAVDEWQIIASFGPWPVSMRSDGAYEMRIRMAGYLSAAGAGKLGIVWSTRGTALTDMQLLGGNTAVYNVTTTTLAWKAGAAEVLTLTADQVAEATTTLSTPVDFGGDPRAVPVVLTSLTVFGQSDDVTKIPRLSALYAAELAP